MAYGYKYYGSFKGLNGNGYRVDIVEKDYTGYYTEVILDDSPLTVEYPIIENKFTTIRGSGCDVNLLSTTSLKFIDMYSTDMFHYLAKVYNTTTSTLIWQGYLNSELYSEPFAEFFNYPVNLTFNDGLALLDRLYYSEGNNQYTGYTSAWNTIIRVLNKIGLEWDIYTGISTTSPDFTISSSETIFHHLYVDNSNFYDEDGQAMTCREVLETILQPFASYVQIINNNLYITDVNYLASLSGTTGSFKKYLCSTGSYSSTLSVNTNIGDVSTIGFASNSQPFNIVSPINKQKVVFSPYRQSLLDYNASDDSYSGYSHTNYYGTLGTRWKEDCYNTSAIWNKEGVDSVSYFVKMQGVDDLTINDKYLLLYNFAGNANHITLKAAPKIIVNNKDLNSVLNKKYYLKVNLSAYFRTETELDADTSNACISKGIIYANLTIGNKKWIVSGITAGWVSTGDTRSYEMYLTNRSGDIFGYTFNPIEDTWTEYNNGISQHIKIEDVLVPLFNVDGTQLSCYDNIFTLSFKYVSAYNTDGDLVFFYDCRIKDIKFTIVDENGEISNDDIEYKSYVDKTIKDDGGDITLKFATNDINTPLTRGGIIGFTGNTYYYLQNFSREGKTDIIENLLLRSIVSNYTSKTIEITCDINMVSSIFGVLTYNNYWNGIYFMIMGCKIDYAESICSLTLQQFNVDNLEIKKNYSD